MNRHHHSRWLPWAIGLALSAVSGTSVGLSSPAVHAAEFETVVVRVSVRESDGSVYRAKPESVRIGRETALEVVSELHRHAVRVSTSPRGSQVQYVRDGGELARRTSSGRARETLEIDGHVVTVDLVPVSVTVTTH